jgi:Mrp family chromosome partitioning ATPase
MSRIEQALRRARKPARSITVSENASTSLTAESQLDQAALADYVPERRRAEPDRRDIEPAPPENAPNPFDVKKVLHRELAHFDPSLQGKLVISRDLNPISFEQYRRLGATLHALQAERGVKTLMVSSAVSQEEDLTVTNLALTLSESYNRRVLLIDADLRRPSVQDFRHLECHRLDRLDSQRRRAVAPGRGVPAFGGAARRTLECGGTHGGIDV